MISILRYFGIYTSAFLNRLLSVAKDSTESKASCFVQVLGKNIPVYQHGFGDIPLLVMGPASLFRKSGLLPCLFDNVFTIYFADLFEKTQNSSTNFSHLTLNDFVDQVESVRQQLGLEKIAVFGHSAGGILALEYAAKYPDRVLLNIIVSAAPIWGDYKNHLTESYFLHNSAKNRQELYLFDQAQLARVKTAKPNIMSSFVNNYNARRAHFYYQPLQSFWKTLWNDLDLDEQLINHYFSLLKDYDVRRRLLTAGIPTFLGLGLYDYSCPFYAWTDDAKNLLSTMDYYIFENSGHYPQVEEAVLFSEKLFEYMEHNKIGSFDLDKNSKLKARL